MGAIFQPVLVRNLPSPRPSRIVALGINLNRFNIDGPHDPRIASLARPVIFHPTRLLPWKGIAIGLAAFQQLRSRLGTGTLVLCATEGITAELGEIAFRAELETEIKNLHLQENVVFLPFSLSDMPLAYRASDLVWYPTTDEEPFGLAPLESMACGTPVIVSASGGMVETVENKLNGLVVPRNDAAVLVNAAYSVLTQPSYRAELVSGALERVKRFDMRVYAATLEGLYQQ
jgi:glycosyltransferase involved in cell wall biosynthesis